MLPESDFYYHRCSSELCALSFKSFANLAYDLTRYLDEHAKWPSSIYVIHIIHVITNAVQPQHRYIPMQNMLERLQATADSASPESQTSMVRSLTYLISAGGGYVGMTVLELVEVLVSQLLSNSNKTAKCTAEATLEQALVEAVGSLVTQVQYPDQVNEILAFLINRLKLELPMSNLVSNASTVETNKPGHSDNMPIASIILVKPPVDTIDQETLVARKILLRCLQMVTYVRLTQAQSVSVRGESGDTSSQMSIRRGMTIHGTNIVRNPVDYSLIRPVLKLLTDDDMDVRVYSAEFLCKLFSLETVEASIGLITESSLKVRGSTRRLETYTAFGHSISGTVSSNIHN